MSRSRNLIARPTLWATSPQRLQFSRNVRSGTDKNWAASLHPISHTMILDPESDTEEEPGGAAHPEAVADRRRGSPDRRGRWSHRVAAFRVAATDP